MYLVLVYHQITLQKRNLEFNCCGGTSGTHLLKLIWYRTCQYQTASVSAVIWISQTNITTTMMFLHMWQCSFLRTSNDAAAFGGKYVSVGVGQCPVPSILSHGVVTHSSDSCMAQLVPSRPAVGFNQCLADQKAYHSSEPHLQWGTPMKCFLFGEMNAGTKATHDIVRPMPNTKIHSTENEIQYKDARDTYWCRKSNYAFRLTHGP